MHGKEEFTDGKGRLRNGSPLFYEMLDEMANTHDIKSHDYASNDNPSGNYHFAGQMATMFSHSPEDAGFIGRLAEKIYRLANLEKAGKVAENESIEDTERDIAVITVLWMTDRQERRAKVSPDESINTVEAKAYTEEAADRSSPPAAPSIDYVALLLRILLPFISDLIQKHQPQKE